MEYSGRAIIHDRKFDRDCELVFGTLERADDRLAAFVFELGHGVAVGTQITPWVTAFVVSGDNWRCVVIAEDRRDHFLLRGLVALAVPIIVAAA